VHRQLGLDGRVFLLSPVPSERLPEVTVSADVGLILFGNTCLNHYYSLPNKLYEYMMAGLPIIASDLPEMRRVIGECRCGVLINSRQPEAIADAIVRMTSSTPEMKAMGKRGREAALHRYNWSVQAKKLLELYAGLSQ
jgi:glycosyltransferase involved in cell wall biosynthesis